MGRGDNRTKKGKIATGSYGVSRPAKPKKDSSKQQNTAAAKSKS